MSEKDWEEYCKSCGCPIEICCKPKKSFIFIEDLEKEIIELVIEASLHTRNDFAKEGYLLALNNLLVIIRNK